MSHPSYYYMKYSIFIILGVFALIFFAISYAPPLRKGPPYTSNTNINPVPSVQQTTTTTANINVQPSKQSQEAVQSVKLYAASSFGVHENDVIVISTVAREWRDSCLGIPHEEELCTAVITPGYEIKIRIENRIVYYRTSNDGSVIRMALEPVVEQTNAEVIINQPQPRSYTKLHRSCSSGNDCDEGVKCIGYYVLPGYQGQQLFSCEIRCAGDVPCPPGLTCGTTADVPGQVCM